MGIQRKMNQENKIVEKVYEEFIVERHICALKGLKYESGEIIFDGIDFNSGFLSFGNQHIDCSIGEKKLKTFSISDTGLEINYKDIKSFKFIDCKFSNDTFLQEI